ncbi:MAG: hypothetical protein WAM14_00485, partial [Candidatus Nitrosopolaris sp.]
MSRRLIEDLRTSNQADPGVHKKRPMDESTLTPDLNNVCEAVNCFEKATTTIDGLTHKDALAKIHNDHDHLPGFTERNIRRYLPANNPNIPRRVRTSCTKNSMTETCERTFSDTKHNDDANIDNIIGRQSVSNFVVDDISGGKPSETPDKTIQIEDATSRRHIK